MLRLTRKFIEGTGKRVINFVKEAGAYHLLLFKIVTKIPIKNLSCGDLIIHAVKTT